MSIQDGEMEHKGGYRDIGFDIESKIKLEIDT